MKVKNIMFSGFAAAILMGVGAANAAVIANPVTLADQGYVDTKVSQAEAAAKKHFDDKYDSESKLSVLLNAKEDAANKVSSDSNVDLSDMTPEEVNQFMAERSNENTKYPTVAAAQQIAQVVLKSVSTTAADVSAMKTKVTTLENVVGADANSGLQKAVADNTSAIETLNGDVNTEGSVAKSIADALDEKSYTTLTEVAGQGYLKSGDLTEYAKTAELNAATVGETGKFIATISETNGIVSASATEFAGEVTADGAIAPTAKAVNDFVTGKGYAVATDVARDYETKANAAATYETKANAAAYAKTVDVNAELANKLDSTALTANGTYMVTKTANGIEYTAVTVATAEDAATE
ncbi:MAG: hypothetical protein IKL37_04000 [Alphaproteobacteria bacterium]|nr:hypothetical protein [Alphaproteobacteria bacterium]